MRAVRAAWGLGVVASVLACSTASKSPVRTVVHAVEVTDNGERKPIPNSGVTAVDVNSSIELEVDPEQVRAAFAAVAGVDQKAVTSAEARLAELRRASSSQKRDWEEFQRLFTEILDAATVAQIVRRAGELETRANTLGKQLLPKEKWFELLASRRPSPEILVEVLAKEVRKVRKELDGMMEQLGRLRWRMQASLMRANGPEFIHLDGYDDLPQGTARVINKLAVPANLLATIQQADAAAKDVQDLQTLRNRVVAVGRKFVGDKARDLLQRLKSLSELQTLLDRVEKAPWAATGAARKLLVAARDFAVEVAPVLARCQPAVDKIGSLAPSSTSDGFGALRDCSAGIASAAAKLAEKGAALGEAVQSVPAAVKRDAKRAAALEGQTQSDLEALDSKLRGLALSELSSLSELLLRGPVRGDPTFVAPERATDRRLTELRDTRIDLVRTSRSPGDLVYFRSAVVVGGTEKSQVTGPPLQLVADGWHIKVSASVVFVQAFEREAQDSSFPAVPAANASLHYHVPRAAGENRSGSFWNFLDPGLGLHVAYLDLGPKQADEEDPATELGIGGTLQLFGDLVQGGAAYDLQVERPYFFVGLGLQTVTNFGVTVPTTGK